MLKRLSSREILENLASDWERQIRLAWIEAIERIRSNIVLKRIVKLERGDVAGVFVLSASKMACSPGSRTPSCRSTTQAGSPRWTQCPHFVIRTAIASCFSWEVRNLPAEQELRRRAAEFVTGVTHDMREGLREILAKNLAGGANPNGLP